MENKETYATKQEPAPVNDQNQPIVWGLVIADMISRSEDGVRKYGVPLRTHNGRDPLVDAYQEALDLCVYLKQAILERDDAREKTISLDQSEYSAESEIAP